MEIRDLVEESGFGLAPTTWLRRQPWSTTTPRSSFTDPLSGNYKIVSIQCFWNEEYVPHFSYLVSIYCSCSDSWRHFGKFNESDVAILALNISNEKFQEIQVRDCIKSNEGDLALYDDSIALLCCDLDKVEKCVDVWVKGNNGWWIRSLNVVSIGNVHSIVLLSFCQN